MSDYDVSRRAAVGFADYVNELRCRCSKKPATGLKGVNRRGRKFEARNTPFPVRLCQRLPHAKLTGSTARKFEARNTPFPVRLCPSVVGWGCVTPLRPFEARNTPFSVRLCHPAVQPPLATHLRLRYAPHLCACSAPRRSAPRRSAPAVCLCHLAARHPAPLPQRATPSHGLPGAPLPLSRWGGVHLRHCAMRWRCATVQCARGAPLPLNGWGSVHLRFCAMRWR